MPMILEINKVAFKNLYVTIPNRNMNPEALRTQNRRLLGPKTILYKAILSLRTSSGKPGSRRGVYFTLRGGDQQLVSHDPAK